MGFLMQSKRQVHWETSGTPQAPSRCPCAWCLIQWDGVGWRWVPTTLGYCCHGIWFNKQWYHEHKWFINDRSLSSKNWTLMSSINLSNGWWKWLFTTTGIIATHELQTVIYHQWILTNDFYQPVQCLIETCFNHQWLHWQTWVINDDNIPIYQ